MKNKHTQNINFASLDLVTISEACEIFQVCRQTIHNWIKMDILKLIKVGRRSYFRRIDLECLISQQCEK
ncbi:MAG: helix-turn-helix domain-containing protein [Bacteroidales bacterium]|nr:helix-turn-helix domain-containing protein [Bacteroidales bacterium]